MRWIVTLSANRRDVELLRAESLPGLSATADDPCQLILEFDDQEADVADEDASHAAKAVIDASVQRINGSGKLRWGRAFEGVTVSAVRSVDSGGCSYRCSRTHSSAPPRGPRAWTPAATAAPPAPPHANGVPPEG